MKDLADGKLLQLKTEIVGTVKELEEKGNAAVAHLSEQLLTLAEELRKQKIRRIINSLDFETRQSRQSDISDTEYRTFEWIFHDLHGPSKQRVGFRNWLQFGDDIYWISGKPGSGKSVLMNYIANEPRTQELLQAWAGDTRLIVAKFFFWNAGAPMQKSQQGLLQSLLHEIYGQCPELVPVVCPRWKRYYDIGATWTRPELSESIGKLGQQVSLNLKFCFFIDGVDEFDGEDHKIITDLLKSLNASPAVKICVSSRPWNIFIAAFGADIDRRLLLEDHNGDDIKIYVKNRFESDEQFALLQSRDSRIIDLVDQIVRNAQGVFLWVRIVVSNLLRGLNNDDNLSDLHRRLESFPTTLTAYFQHMFESIDDFYREETSEILLICLEGIQPLSLLALWFYEQARIAPDYALQAERIPLSRADIVSIFEKIHKRINARGQDLLVIETDTGNLEHVMYTVRFSHRTVKDFLLKPNIFEKLKSWTSKDFDARVTLCKASLAIVKSLPSSTDITNNLNANRCYNHISDFFSYAHLIEEDEGFLDDAVVDEFQRVISSFRKPNVRVSGLLLPLGRAIEHWAFWVDKEDIGPADDTAYRRYFSLNRDMTYFFLAVAVEANLKHYVEHTLTTKPHIIIDRDYCHRPMLDRALRSLPLASKTWRIDTDMIHILLMRGANPNEEFTLYEHNTSSGSLFSKRAWTTTWALFLQNLYEGKPDQSRKSPDLVRGELEATKLMIENGAAADLRPWKIHAFDGRSLQPSDVLHEVFPPHDAAVLDQLMRKHRPWTFRQARSLVRRTILLWFYRDIDFLIWTLTSFFLSTIFFIEDFGLTHPMVTIPTAFSLYLLIWWLLGPFISFVISGTAPVLLSALILSDWLPIVDALVWFNNLIVWQRKNPLSLTNTRSDDVK